MPDDQPVDDESLDELQAHLAEAAAGGSQQAEEILAHVQRYQADDDLTTEDHRNLRKRLSDDLLHFETSHPSLTATMQAVVNSFTASGM